MSAAKKQTTATTPIHHHKEKTFLFSKNNYTWMTIGAVIIILGMFLMTGGKNQDPTVFDEKVVYATQRITIAPILILLGFVIEIYAIFKNPKAAA
ncbi:MAG: hypothetical protein AMXMBFR79_17480 [Chitinophagaceae bacterium]|nr:DUF3098 domain-containing protein [Chitinophagales bacterium]